MTVKIYWYRYHLYVRSEKRNAGPIKPGRRLVGEIYDREENVFRK
jgi:hypothetical protein